MRPPPAFALSFQTQSSGAGSRANARSGGAVRFLAIAIAISLAVYTVLAMAGHPTFLETQVASAGFISVYPFDIVLGLALLALLAGNAFTVTTDPVGANRVVVSLCIAYLAYQVFVVLPYAVLLHDLGPIDVIRDLEVRLGLILVLAIYGIVLRYLRPAVLVTLLDLAAVALAIWVIRTYVTTGGRGQEDLGRFSVREIWGGATLLFGWLFFTSIFYWPMRWWRFLLAVLAIGGIVLANHRSGFVALLAGLVVQMAATGRLTRRVIMTAAVIVVVGGGVYYAAPTVRESAAYSLRTMFNSTSDANAQDRVVRSQLGFDYFVAHPLGDYVWTHRYYLVNVDRDFAPHNFVVQLLDTQGAISSLLMFAIMGVAAAIGWRNRADPLSTVMLAYLTFYLVFCLFNTTIDQFENFVLFPTAVALLLYQNRVLQEEQSPAALPAVGAAYGDA